MPSPSFLALTLAQSKSPATAADEASNKVMETIKNKALSLFLLLNFFEGIFLHQ
jgi:hypothetical protein